MVDDSPARVSPLTSFATQRVTGFQGPSVMAPEDCEWPSIFRDLMYSKCTLSWIYTNYGGFLNLGYRLKIGFNTVLTWWCCNFGKPMIQWSELKDCTAYGHRRLFGDATSTPASATRSRCAPLHSSGSISPRCLRMWSALDPLENFNWKADEFGDNGC